MRYRKLDAEGDMVFGNGGQDYHLNTPEAVAQACLTRLRQWQGEWFADTSDGTPWLTDVLGERTQAIYETVIRSRILLTPGVKQLVSFSTTLDVNRRSVSIDATLETIYGHTRFNQELLA